MCLAIPGQVIELVEADRPFAVVEVSGVRRTVNVELIDQAAEGDWVLIHVGFAMSRISADEAREQLRLLAMMGEVGDALSEVPGYAFDADERMTRSGDEVRRRVS